MEVFFCGFLNFFPQPYRAVRREEDQAKQQGHSVRGDSHHKQRGGTEQQKIEHRPQKESCRHVDTHLSAAGGSGVAEKPHRQSNLRPFSSYQLSG